MAEAKGLVMAALARHRARLERLVAREAGWLLPLESVEDLLQGAQCRIVAAADGYVHESDAALSGWLTTLTRRHLADRRDHWKARRRSAAAVLRITRTSESTAVGIIPVEEAPGPRTHAERRELLELAMRALEALPDRDRELMQMAAAGMPLAEQAEALGVSYAAAQRASHRATERLRGAMRALAPESLAPKEWDRDAWESDRGRG